MAFAFPKTYAQQSTDPCGTTTFDCYQESGFRLNSDPVICMDLDVDRNVKGKLQAYVQTSVMEWANGLSSNGGNADWGIQLMPLASSDGCNITLQFVANPTPAQQNSPDVMGVTYLHTDHTAHVEIFYNSADTEGELLWTIKHELGHAFGLGHYMITKDERDQNFVYSKSIMIPISLTPWVDSGATMDVRPTITPMDIEQLKSLYNNQGFGGHAWTTSSSIQSPTTQQISISTDKQIYYYGDHVIITIDVPKVTGANATLTLVTRGSQTEPTSIPVIISELHGTITSLALDETNSPTGTVDAALSYDGQTASTSFQIAGHSSSSVTTPPANPNTPTMINPEPIPTVSHPAPQLNPQLDPTADNYASMRSEARDWASGQVDDGAFVDFVQWLSFVNAIQIQQTSEIGSQTFVPIWVKQNTKLWLDGDLSDHDYLTALQYLLENKIITLKTSP